MNQELKKITEGKKVLLLTLQRKWFDLTYTGLKLIEYRYPSCWIKQRLFDENGKKREYDYILYYNGYGHDKPFCLVNFMGFTECQEPAVRNFESLKGVKSRLEIRKGDIAILHGSVVMYGNI